MKTTAVALSCLLALSTAVTPVQKCVEMLTGMKENAKKAKHEENVQYAGFKQFCGDTQVSKTESIKKLDGQISLLKADFEKADSEQKRLGKEVNAHQTDIGGWEKDNKDATKLRKGERATYVKTHLDYTESVNALGQAIMMLKRQNFDRKAKGFLQQVSAFAKTPDGPRRAIQAFLDNTARDREEDTQPDLKATAYSFQSGEIITMLEKLKEQFKGEKTAIEKAEVEGRHVYDTLIQGLTAQTTDAKNAIQEKRESQSRNKLLFIEKSEDHKLTTGEHTVESKYLVDLTALCGQKTDEFAARTKLRDEEIEALEKAVDILSGDDVTAVQKHLPSLAQKKTSSAFAQLRVAASAAVPNQLRAAAFLHDESMRLDSHVLSAIAFEARGDPLGKVKKLIEELVTRLKQQAINEASHKGFCDKELATNKHTRETKTREIDTLTSAIEGLDASIASLKMDVEKKNGIIAEVLKSIAEFTSKRDKEKTTNEATIKEAKDGQTAIALAVKTLQDFFAKASKATSFLEYAEHAQPEGVPEIFDGEFKGQQGAKGGIIGMLNVISSDFARLEADTKSSEAAGKSEYDKFMGDSAVMTASVKVDIKHAESTQLAKEGELTKAKEDLTSSTKTLTAADDTYEKLKETCINTGESTEERFARRNEEVSALKEALRILSGDDIAALQEETKA